MPDTLRLKKPIFYVYFMKGAKCNRATIWRSLHGQRVIRIVANDFGKAVHKPYEYPGIPHVDIAPSVIAVEKKEAPKIEELFRRFNVRYLLIEPRKVVNGRR